MLGALVLLFLDRNAELPSHLVTWDLRNVADVVANLGVPAIGMVLAARRPRNPIGWLFLVAGGALAVGSLASAYAVRALLVDAGSLPAGRFFAWLSNWVWPIAICMLLFLFLLFPDGRLLSRRWRPVAWLAAATLVFLVAGTLVLATWRWSRPFGQDLSVEGPVLVLANAVLLTMFLVFPLLMLAAFASVFLRFRRSTGDERLQLKWFVTAAGFVAVTFALTASPLTGTLLASLLSTASLLFMYCAIALAVLKHRLYEIDVVIGKTVVFAVLAAFITVVYVGVVVGVGTLVGTDRSPFLSAVAAALVAVAFQPVRVRARRIANRVVYGDRATPYEVLSGFTERAGETYSTDDVLPRLVRVLGEGIRASEVRVWLCVGSELRQAAAWPDAELVTPPKPFEAGADDLPRFPEGERAFPVRQGLELLGAISVIAKPSEPLGPDRERLVADVAAQTGLVLRNVRLIEELRASRRRIVATQDDRARVLERNIHDGAQQQLVALAVKQRLAESFVDRDPAKAKAMLAEIQVETQEALEDLRDLARGIYPPLLADQGLGAALSGQARKAAVPVDVESDGIGRYPQEIESAVYFCCLEALQNVAKYAQASRVTIRLVAADGGLRFEVRDDGVGFDARATRHGTGLQGMADRLDAVKGSFEVRSAPGEGTTVVGNVPAP